MDFLSRFLVDLFLYDDFFLSGFIDLLIGLIISDGLIDRLFDLILSDGLLLLVGRLLGGFLDSGYLCLLRDWFDGNDVINSHIHQAEFDGIRIGIYLRIDLIGGLRIVVVKRNTGVIGKIQSDGTHDRRSLLKIGQDHIAHSVQHLDGVEVMGVYPLCADSRFRCLCDCRVLRFLHAKHSVLREHARISGHSEGDAIQSNGLIEGYRRGFLENLLRDVLRFNGQTIGVSEINITQQKRFCLLHRRFNILRIDF